MPMLKAKTITTTVIAAAMAVAEIYNHQQYSTDTKNVVRSYCVATGTNYISFLHVSALSTATKATAAATKIIIIIRTA